MDRSFLEAFFLSAVARSKASRLAAGGGLFPVLSSGRYDPPTRVHM
jgi:hypothetical protein